MTTVTVKTSELVGAALDWAVDWAVSGKPLDVLQKKNGSGEWAYFHEGNWFALGPRKYSTDWSQGGPLIQINAIEISPGDGWQQDGGGSWGALIITDRIDADCSFVSMNADTPLIAACRSIVAAKLGDTVEVPEVLL